MLHRRQLLADSLVGGLLSTSPRLATAKPADHPVAFFPVADTHFPANQDDPAKLEERSAAVTARRVGRVND